MKPLHYLILAGITLSTGSIFGQGNWETGAGNPCLGGPPCSPAPAGGVNAGNNFLGTAIGNNTSLRIGTNGIQDLNPYAVFQKHT